MSKETTFTEGVLLIVEGVLVLMLSAVLFFEGREDREFDE